jgi:LysR family pca operon transcriptional activator
MNDVRIRLRHLQCFLSIAQHKGVGTAADALRMTQPALSKTLRELEEILDTRLFERGRKGMALTRSGEIFLEYAAGSVAAIRSGVDRLRAEKETSGRHVTVGARPTAETRLLPNAIREFKKKMPDTSVRVVAGDGPDLLRMLRVGEVDFVVGRLVAPESMIELSFQELYTEPLTIVVRQGHALTTSKRPKLSDLLIYPCVLPPHGNVVREEIERFFIARGQKHPRNVVETASVGFGRSYTMATDSVWFAARGIVAPDLESGVLVSLAVGMAAQQAPVGIFVRAGLEPSPASKQLIAAVRQAAGSAAVAAT